MSTKNRSAGAGLRAKRGAREQLVRDHVRELPIYGGDLTVTQTIATSTFRLSGSTTPPPVAPSPSSGGQDGAQEV